MGQIFLFKIEGGSVYELEGSFAPIERDLQTLVEKNLKTFLAIDFLKTEHSTGKKHGGRIDTLGIDENYCPVIIEYKRHQDSAVILQGLNYLSWLDDHHGDFESLARKILPDQNLEVNWSSRRLVFIASDFTDEDINAIEYIQDKAYVELYRYRRYDDILLLELVKHVPENAQRRASAKTSSVKPQYPQTVPSSLADLYNALEVFIVSLGDDVQRKQLKRYNAYQRIRNFACAIPPRPGGKSFKVYVKLNPKDVTLEVNFSKDVHDKGHWGTGDLELTIKNLLDLEKAKPLVIKSYEAN